MKSFAHLLVVLALPLALVNCGKSDEKKAQENAQSLTEEQNRLAAEINNSGAPSASWSDESLNSLEAKLNRLEAVESQLRAHNGRNGVTVLGGDNSSVIADRRSLIAQARAAKVGSPGASNADASVRAKTFEHGNLVDEIQSIGQGPKLADNLDVLEQKVNRLEALENELNELRQQGHNVGYVNNRMKILSLRQKISDLRAQKMNEPAYENAKKQVEEAETAFQALKAPTSASSVNEIAAYEKSLDDIEAKLREAEGPIAIEQGRFPLPSMAKIRMDQLKKRIEVARQSIPKKKAA